MWHLCFCRRSNRIQIRNVPAHVPKEELDRLVTTFGNPQKCDIGRLCLHTQLSSKNNCWLNCVPRETDWSYRWLASVLKSSVSLLKSFFSTSWFETTGWRYYRYRCDDTVICHTRSSHIAPLKLQLRACISVHLKLLFLLDLNWNLLHYSLIHSSLHSHTDFNVVLCDSSCTEVVMIKNRASSTAVIISFSVYMQ